MYMRACSTTVQQQFHSIWLNIFIERRVVRANLAARRVQQITRDKKRTLLLTHVENQQIRMEFNLETAKD